MPTFAESIENTVKQSKKRTYSHRFVDQRNGYGTLPPRNIPECPWHPAWVVPRSPTVERSTRWYDRLMPSEIEANREAWNHWTARHLEAPFYDVEGFRRGVTSLKPIERAALGNVAGRSLLHLQCHFGLDTLSWARAGAHCVGVDFAPRAIEEARSLAIDLDLDARFVCADVLNLREHLDQRFDIVFTSYGVLWWLADLNRWAQVVADLLAPGGTFFVVEFHPLLYTLDNRGVALDGDYFRRVAPVRNVDQHSYAEVGTESKEVTTFGWNHPLGDVVTALLSAGLQLEYLREHDSSPFDCFPFTVPSSDGGPDRFVVRGCEGRIPMLFSIRATAPNVARQ